MLDLFVLQGQLMFESVGNFPAPAFFNVNETSGVITIAKSLTQDGLNTANYKVCFVFTERVKLRITVTFIVFWL